MRWLLSDCPAQHYTAAGRFPRPDRLQVPGPVEVDARDPEGRTALFHAASYGEVGAAGLLLQRRAEANARDVSGSCPLHLAVAKGSAAVVKLLLEAAADPEARAPGGATALLCWARLAAADADVCAQLLQSGACLSAADEEGRTVLHLLATSPRLGHKELCTLSLLLALGVDCDARDRRGRTALDLCDDPVARDLLSQAYYTQEPLRVEKWGPQGRLPPPADGLGGCGVSPEQQVTKLTGGPPLLCVLHKGLHAFVARTPCRACRVGLVVVGPYAAGEAGRGSAEPAAAAGLGGKASQDYYVRCARCGETEILSANRVRSVV